jgi:hypothetical protein
LLLQAGLLNNKSLADRAQKTSLYGWFGGSLCTIVLELNELSGGWVGAWVGGWLHVFLSVVDKVVWSVGLLGGRVAACMSTG